MPIIKSAKKKLRQDIKRHKINEDIKNAYKKEVKAAMNSKKTEAVIKAISAVNKAAKRDVIHKNKASRLTSKLAKLIKPTATSVAKSQKVKKTRKKVEKK